MNIEDNANEGTVVAEPKGGADAPADKTNPKGNETVPEPSGEENLNAGAEGGEAEPGAGTDEGEPGAEGSGAEPKQEETTPDPLAEFTERMEKRFELLEKAVKPQERAPAPVEPTEEQWAELETKTQMPRAGIKHVATMMERGLKAIERKFEERLSAFESEKVLETVSADPSFSDAKTLKTEVQTYLKKFAPADRSDPELVKDAIIYARGLKSKAAIARAAKGQERNKHITGAARPASPNGGGNTAQAVLSSAQKQAASMLPGGEAEYRKIQAAAKKNGGPAVFD